MGSIVMIYCRTERVPKFLHVILELTNMLSELTDTNLNILRLLFNLQAAQSL
ncbi:hypothetical protein D3C72_2560920 [compost metagenome]